MAPHRRTPELRCGKPRAASNLGGDHSAAFERFLTVELTDEEALAPAQLPRRPIDDDHYPLSPRLAPLKAILGNLDPPKSQPAIPPPLKSRMAPSAGRRRRRE
jgi:hypothetical protein